MVTYCYVGTARSKSDKSILGYRLKLADKKTGKIEYFDKNRLKDLILQGKIYVLGMEIYTDGTLCQRRASKSSSELSQELLELGTRDLQLVLSEASEKNAIVNKIPTVCNHVCYLISYSPLSHILYIPTDVKRLNTNWTTLEFTRHLQGLAGEITVRGKYATVENINGMFVKCKFDRVKFQDFNTKSIHDLSNIFFQSDIGIIDLSDIDFSGVHDMFSMFSYCKSKKIIITGMKTANVKSMACMFSGCKADVVGLSNLNTHNVTTAGCMFSGFTFPDSFNIKDLDFSNIRSLSYTFSGCKIRNLAIDFRTMPNLESVAYMFSDYCGETLRLTGLTSKYFTIIGYMFLNAQIVNLEITDFDLSKVDDVSDIFHSSRILNFRTDNIRLQTSYSRREETESGMDSIHSMYAGANKQDGKPWWKYYLEQYRI